MKKTITAIALLSSFATFADSPIAIAIHGGAGTIKKENMSAEKEQAIRATLEQAVSKGYKLLQQGKPSLDVISAAITVLEDSPLFNAGVGAVYNYEGKHDLDASIMDGKTKNAGAVAGVKTIKNPILLARDVMDKSVHVMLAGKGAEHFAESLGYDKVENSVFDTERRHKAWEKARKKLQKDTQASLYQENPEYRYGTVGAVALDKQGNLAAGTSTGGMTAKRWGRVGDSPIIGAGTYADNNSCAVSATGWGEYFIRYHVAADICSRVKYLKQDVTTASEQVINKELKDAGGTGGVIVVGNKGDIALTFNTSGMYRASVDTDGNINVAIFAKK